MPEASDVSVWINGEAQFDPQGAHLSARDRGVTLADGLFETMRLRNGIVFRLEQHLARLRRGLDVLQMAEPPSLRSWIDAAVRHRRQAGDLSLRLTVTRGVAPGGLAPAATVAPTVILVIAPLPVVPSSIYTGGLTVHVASGVFNERAMTVGVKSLSYTDAVVAMLEARRHGADDAIFLNTRGECCEASASNLFIRSGDALITPSLACGALPGITRATVLELAGREGIRCHESAFGLDDLLAASEVFLTSALRGVAPVVRVGERPIGSGRPGPATARLTTLLAECIDAETR